jgi:hypothetical protein
MLRASGKEKESKNDTDVLEVMPYELLKMPQSIAELVVSYAIDTPWVLNKSIFFTNVDCTLQQILLLAKCAGPLKEFQFLVEKLALTAVPPSPTYHIRPLSVKSLSGEMV